MSHENRARRKAQLLAAYDQGILDEDTYQAALAALDEPASPQTDLEETAAAIGDKPVAVGRQGVHVGGNVGRDVHTGDRKVDAGQYIERYYAADPGQAVDVNALRTTYLRRLVTIAGQMSLAGIDPKAASDAGEARLSLNAVYTALLTSRIEGVGAEGEIGALAGRFTEKGQPVSALAQLNQHSHLVLLGEPGSGKSTFVDFVTMCLAGALLGRADMNLDLLTAPLPDKDGEAEEARQSWTHGPLLPLRVILRDLAARGLPPAGEAATADHLWAFLARESATAAYAPFLSKDLRRQGGLILFDGLDEVSEAQQRRTQIRQLVEDVVATLPEVRVLVTSRTYAYQQQDWRLAGFSEAILAPFTPGQIRRFIRHWYDHIAVLRHMHEADARRRAAALEEAIFASDRLQGLAERPLLLTLMASLHAWRGGNLPEKREELYDNTVDLLLEWWERPKVVANREGEEERQPSLAEWLKVDRDKVRALLYRLAYQAHVAQPELIGTADIAEELLVSGLMALSRNPDVKPGRLIEYLSHRAGLLLPRGIGVFTFPHRTFQEYLAACYLANLEHLPLLTRLAQAEPNRWREVLLLAVARSERGFTSSTWLFVDSLCGLDCAGDETEAAALWGAHLAAQALVETAELEQLNAANAGKVERVRDWLVHIMRGSTLPAVERALAARNLAHLGDPRPEAIAVDDMHFCFVPAGPFSMGSDETLTDDDPNLQQALVSERPLHELDLPYAYWIGRYPVTNAQFQPFVEEGSYGVARYWPEAQAAKRWREGEIQGYTYIVETKQYDRLWRKEPHPYGAPYDLPNHPVVGLTWYEMLAFTRWLTERWQAAGWLPPGWAVQLPTEAEWEKAARGGHDVPQTPAIGAAAKGLRPLPLTMQPNPGPQRRYPWGEGSIDSGRANYRAAGIDAPNGVGCFAAGASPYGCEEMSGNIYEWTRSLYGRYDGEKSKSDGPIVFEPWYRYPYRQGDGREVLDASDYWPRVIRGGAFVAPDTWHRCAYRYWYYPNYRNVGFGFRVVVSPFTSGR